jgi:hypothetical protein
MTNDGAYTTFDICARFEPLGRMFERNICVVIWPHHAINIP